MKIILGNRGSGKTTKLIKECAKDNNAVIVCVTEQNCRYIFETSRRLGYVINYPITFRKFFNYDYNRCEFKNFYFDNIDVFFEKL